LSVPYISVAITRLQVADLPGQRGVVRHPLVDRPDNTGEVDEVSDASKVEKNTATAWMIFFILIATITIHNDPILNYEG
jgi:hypothetical protein